ncbi:hypothetical protein ACHAXT_008725 [Thalassiosira profunda]
MIDVLADLGEGLSEHLPLTPFACQIGLLCAVAQILFTLMFHERTQILPAGPWTKLSLFSAHQVVALPAMLILTYAGWRDWFFDPARTDGDLNITAADRIFGYSHPEDFALAFGSGAILLWDIPMGFISPPLRDPIMWAHHLGMFLVAATMSGAFCKHGNFIGYWYSSFYFGVIESSSVFLGFVDVFHPKYQHYYRWLNAEHADEKSKALQKIVHSANEVARMLFAVTFLALRTIYFPYVTFRLAIPDLIEAYEYPPDGVPLWTGYFLVGMMSLFACLQAYWGLLIAKQVKKALVGGGGGKDEKKKTK